VKYMHTHTHTHTHTHLGIHLGSGTLKESAKVYAYLPTRTRQQGGDDDTNTAGLCSAVALGSGRGA
jgi:hypothetical protein